MQATTHTQDTAESWITRCPECKTAFRITRKHLMAAKGAVRCGSCLHVFKAYQHMVGSELPEDLLPTPEPSSTAEFPEPPQQKQSFSTAQNKESTTTSIDELELSDDAFSLDDSTNTSYQFPVEEHSSENSDDEAWARAMLEEMDLEEDISPTPEPEPEPQPKPQEEKAEPKSQTESSNGSSETKSTENSLDSLDDAPISLHYRKESHLKRIALPLACLFAVATLAGQYLWFNFADIARTPKLRPLAASLCNLLPCQLPELKDLTQVRVRNIVVRNDPEFRHALNIDAIITNDANFSQPYPDLLMVVSDKNQDVLGTRVLSPEQYLSGEAAGARKMASRQPVHLALKIISPGPDAHNITFDFPE